MQKRSGTEPNICMHSRVLLLQIAMAGICTTCRCKLRAISSMSLTRTEVWGLHTGVLSALVIYSNYAYALPS